MLSLKEIIISYNQKCALNISELTFLSGITSVIGNNGSGKSTLLKALLDLVKPDRGQILYQGSSFHKDEKWKSITSAWLDEAFLIDFLSYQEHLDYLQSIYRRKTILNYQAFENLILDDDFDKKKLIRDLSQGNKTKVGILFSILSDPKILILDEPFAFLDCQTQINLKKVLKELVGMDEERIILISTHHFSLLDVSHQVILLDQGNLKMYESLDDTTLAILKNTYELE